MKEIRVVDDEQKRTSRGEQPRGAIRSRPGGSAEIECGDHVREEHDRVVVARVDPEPGDRAWVGGGPLREEGRLPIARGRDDADDGGRLAPEPVDERRSGDQTLTERRRPDLGLDDLKRPPRP
jgi:hypothetical protein